MKFDDMSLLRDLCTSKQYTPYGAKPFIAYCEASQGTRTITLLRTPSVNLVSICQRR